MEDWEKITQDFSKAYGGPKAAGKLLGKSARTLCGWISGDHAPGPTSRIRIRNYMIIKETDGLQGITLEEIAQRLGLRIPGLGNSPKSVPSSLEKQPIVPLLPYFELVKQAVLFQKEGGERRGRLPKNAKKCAEINRTCGLFNEYTDAKVAKKYELGSADTFQRAKAILASKRHELMEAVHEELLTIHGAWKLLQVSAAETCELLGRKNIKEIQAFIAGLSKQ